MLRVIIFGTLDYAIVDGGTRGDTVIGYFHNPFN
jgi:hypothetical protein